jgi:hypothetical protein
LKPLPRHVFEFINGLGACKGSHDIEYGAHHASHMTLASGSSIIAYIRY